MNQDTARYTPKQIMCGLRIAWPQSTGDKLPFSETTRVAESIERSGWDDLDFAILAYELDRFFGWNDVGRRAWNRAALPAWRSFMESELDRITFGSMASFIADRIPAVPMEPVFVLGKRCAPAGAFRSIEQVVRQLDLGVPRFAPSARITSILRGRPLRTVWNRLRWMSEERLPPLRRTWTNRVVDALNSGPGLLAMLGAAALLSIGLHSIVVGIITTVSFRIVVGLFLRGCEWIQNPVPSRFDDFRDVSRAMAARP